MLGKRAGRFNLAAEMDEAVNTVRSHQIGARLGSSEAFHCLGVTFASLRDQHLALRCHRKEYSLCQELWKASGESDPEAALSLRRACDWLGRSLETTLRMDPEAGEGQEGGEGARR